MPTLWMLSAAILGVFIVFVVISKRRGHLPPGPPPKFWTGNIHQLPVTRPWVTYAKWAEKYGPLVFFRMHGQRVLVLNNYKAASDLLDGRSATYSDRPMAWMYKELVGRKLAVFNISSKHPRFRRYRALLQGGLNPRAARGYRAVQEEQARVLVAGLAGAPERFVSHVRRFAGGIILKVAYGWTVADDNDFFVSLIEDAFKAHAYVARPGYWLVDSYPILRFVPAWFPFATFKREAARHRALFSKVDTAPHEWAKKQMATGDYVESFTSMHLRPESGGALDPEEEDMVKWCSAALYAGGADTVVGVITGFILNMTLHPDVQKTAQAELERVVGNRLPTADDIPNLPYIAAVVTESLRWASVTPLGLPHLATEDDTYAGYLIPKGTTVYANIWAIAHDPEMYPDPHTFDPTRFLPKAGVEMPMDPRRYVFGFGRRVCPGAHLAELSAFLAMTYILSVFRISKALDENGKEVEPEIEFTSTVTTHVKPFRCRIAVRNADLLPAEE